MDQRSIATLAAQASALRRAGRVAEAIVAYQELLALRADLPDSWYNLGLLQRRQRDFESALDSYQQALDRGVTGPEEVHVNRAVIFSDHLGRPDEAARELNQALTLNPLYIPALLNLGNLEEDLGERNRARGCYERALTVDPDNMLALARLAGVADAAASNDPLILRLRAALDRSEIGMDDRADLGFALGRLLDVSGAYDSAFAAYAAANAASRSGLLATGHPGYDAMRHEQLVDRLIETFARPVEPRPDIGVRAPLFICGMFRSGSSLAEQILASHSRVAPGGERDLIPSLVSTRLQPYPESCAVLGPDDCDRLRRDYEDGMSRIASDKRMTTDKRPDNFLHIGLIKTMFPTAKIIHTVRNPLDNVLSLYFLHLNPEMSYGLDLRDAAHWYRQYRRLMTHWKALYPDDIFDLDYDALVKHPRSEIEDLLTFCGLKWEGAVLSFHAAPSAVKTASVWQVREPLYARSSGRWRAYEQHLAPIRDALDDIGKY